MNRRMAMEKPASNRYRPVTLLFANMYGPDPRALPIPGERDRHGVYAPLHAESRTAYMLCDGSIWEYRGISGYDIDNKERVRGWECIWRP
jgi:hypothetical protein